MGSEPGFTIFYAGFFVLISALIVVSWPWRRERQFSLRRFIAAARQTVWNVYLLDPDGPGEGVHDPRVVSAKTLQEDPKITECVFDASGGRGVHLITLVVETLIEESPKVLSLRIRDADGKAFPFGPRSYDELKLEEHPEGTVATLNWRGETLTLWQFLVVWRNSRSNLIRLQRYCESGAARPQERLGQAFWTCVAVSLVAVGSFAVWLGWVGALVLAGILITHEFGHWIALRLTGQPAPRMMLVPFFGGIAVGNYPHKSLFDQAFCSLMGAGFSALPCLVLLSTAAIIGMPDVGTDWREPDFDTTSLQGVALVTLLLSALIGFLNVIQLVPVLPLDGGRVLQAIISSFSVKWARLALLLLAGLGLAIAAYFGYVLLAAVLVLGCLQAWHLGYAPTKARPMRAPQVSVICLGYGLTVAAHMVAVIYGFYLFRFFLP